MAEFVYNNAKNTSISFIPFKLNCKYHFRGFFEDKTNSYSKSCFANKLVDELRELIEICY